MFRALIPLATDFERLWGYNRTAPASEKKPNVLVVGYGWAGRAFCENIDKSKYDVNVISPTPHFLNTPKLVEFPKIGYPRNLLAYNVVPVTGMLADVVPIEKKILLKTNFYKHYDYLVLAVGSVPNTFGIKGAETCHFLKTLHDFGELKQVMRNGGNEKKSFEVIGAGPTGVEVAFELAAAGANVKLVEAGADILGGWSEVTRSCIRKELAESGIELLVGCAVKEIGTDLIHTSTGSIVRNHTIWTSGVKAPDFVSRGGFNKVGPHLQVANMDSIYAIGDIVAGGHGPPTAQNAVQQGKFLARYFNSDFAAEHPPYKYNEFCKILHTKDSIYVEYDGTTFIMPKMVGWILDKFTGI